MDRKHSVKRRIAALVLSAAMLVGILPGSAFASENTAGYLEDVSGSFALGNGAVLTDDAGGGVKPFR